eukprot:824640-Prorocentrum_minimum.AAC.1
MRVIVVLLQVAKVPRGATVMRPLTVHELYAHCVVGISLVQGSPEMLGFVVYSLESFGTAD